jgi:hypothetical protein
MVALRRLLGSLALVAALPATALAKKLPDFATPESTGSDEHHGVDLLFEGWRRFGDGWLLVDMVMVLVLALVLGAAIAYHPAVRRRVSTLEHYEQPKTVLLYAVVSAVVALIVEVQPAMAFVIFGIGGLLRFRTLVGEAKETGQVILVTVVGLCCGLKIFVVAVPATVIGWLLIFYLERDTAGIIRISGVAEAAVHQATRAYRAAIQDAGCSIIGEQMRFVKREFVFVVKAPPTFDRGALLEKLDAFPSELRGVVDFERI